MSEGVVIGLSVIGCVLGFFLNRVYANKYGEAAIQWKPFILQFICTVGALSQLPDEEVSFRFLLWIIAAVFSYAAGLWLCRQHAKKQKAEPGDTVCAIAAQAVLPFGAALAFMMVAGMVLFGFVWAH